MDAAFEGGGFLLPPPASNHTNNGTGIPAYVSAADILSLATVIGSSLSLVGLVFAFITYSLFSDLRSLAGTTLMNLFAGLFLAQLLFVVGVERTAERHLCRGLSFALHYLCVSVFMWLACMTHDLYTTFRDNINLQPVVMEDRIRSNFWRYTLVSWGLPLVLSGVAVAIHCATLAEPELHSRRMNISGGVTGHRGSLVHNNRASGSVNSRWSHEHTSLVRTQQATIQHNCWVLEKPALLYTFAIPLCVMTVFIAVYFVKAAIVIRYISSLQVTRKAKRKMSRSRHLHLFLYIKIFVLEASVWTCGFVAKMADNQGAWLAFQLLFALQGVIVAVAYTCNSRVLNIYANSFRHQRKQKEYGASELSQSASLQLLTWEPQPDAV